MTERPILFSAPMVRAILAGAKTETRRLLKPQPFIDQSGNLCSRTKDGNVSCWGQGTDGKPYWRHFVDKHVRFAIGDRLWVRETWHCAGNTQWNAGEHIGPGSLIVYKANHGKTLRDREWKHGHVPMTQSCYATSGIRWKPAIHMPRWASRITLDVTAVRVERLQDITEEGAIAEGVTKVRDHCYVVRGFDYDLTGLCHSSAITPYAKLWNTLHTKPGTAWDDNPWIVVIQFKRFDAKAKQEAA